MSRGSRRSHPPRTRPMSVSGVRLDQPQAGRGTHVKIIRMTHFQTAVPAGGCRLVAVANNVFKIVAASPLAWVSSYVAFHCVVFGKVVPRADESDCLHGRMRLTVGSVEVLG